MSPTHTVLRSTPATPRACASCFVASCIASMLLCYGVLAPASVRAWHELPEGSDAWPKAFDGAIRGVTVGPIESSQQPGRGYGTRYSAELLDTLARMGVNWISITPFGRIWSLESTRILRTFELPYPENRRGIRRMIAQAHARGIRVLMIPHLWVDTGGWRGEIDPGSEAGWRAYRRAYREHVMAWAEDAGDWNADAFSVGVECKSWSGRFGGYWRALIEDVRGVFPGLLTYSANWDEAPAVLFWDQLDFIGINAFYPLADHDDASYEEYLEGAQRALEGVEHLTQVLRMPAVFVEAGYTTRRNAAVEPWLWPDHMEDVTVDEREQARALSALLTTARPHRWFAGFFVWRYYANLDDVSQEAIWGFSPHGKLAEDVLESLFESRWAADRKRPFWRPPPWHVSRPLGWP